MAQETIKAEEASEAPAVDRAFVDDFAQRWLAAWNSHDPERVLGLMHEEIVYDDSVWPTTMRGHADVREFLDHTWRAFPDLRFEEVEAPFLHPDEPKAAFYWRGYATHTGPIDPPGIAPTGRRMVIEGGDFHEYRDGKLARLRIVFNMADSMRQLGGLPPAGSRGERVTARLLSLRTRLRARK